MGSIPFSGNIYSKPGRVKKNACVGDPCFPEDEGDDLCNDPAELAWVKRPMHRLGGAFGLGGWCGRRFADDVCGMTRATIHPPRAMRDDE